MKTQLLYAGLDVDDQAFHFYGESRDTGEVVEFKCLPSVPCLIKKLDKAGIQPASLRICYEASYLGYSLYRELSKEGYEVAVVAPSLIPEMSSKKVKTDKLDSKKLARYYAGGLLTFVKIPTEENEADRDLLRSRRFLVDQLRAVKTHINAFCRRQSLDFRKETKLKNLWTQTYMLWLEQKTESLASKSQKVLLNTLLESFHSLSKQIETLETEINHLANTEKYRKPVMYLNCFRGMNTLSSLTIILELGDIRRFRHPRQLTSYTGLDITEHSSGGKEVKFGVTRMGNRHIRTTVVEACQYATWPVKVGKHLRNRRKGADAKAMQIADRCMNRLYKKGIHLTFKGKHTNKVKMACAREMLGFLWESLQAAA